MPDRGGAVQGTADRRGPGRPNSVRSASGTTLVDGRPAGPGRVLVLAYGFFALAAGARSAVQLSTHAGRAPLAYLLSALAASSYLLAAFVLNRSDREPVYAPIARALCVLELLGVVSVGTVSLLRPGLFPDATVWSHFGSGYGCVPAALPVLALFWLRRHQAL